MTDRDELVERVQPLGMNDTNAAIDLIADAITDSFGPENEGLQIVAKAVAERGDGWRTMDSAPRGWDDVLVFSPEHEGFNNGGVFSAFYDPDRGGWFTHWVGENMRLNPTKWRPLPAPPAALAQEGQSDG